MEIRVIRSQRRTLTLRVGFDLVPEVRAPRSTAQKRIDAFVAANASWIERRLCAVRSARAAHASVLDGKAMLYRGETVPVVGKSLGDLARELRALAERELPDRLNESADSRRPNKVRITAAKTLWGSCGANGTISLNRLLVCLPIELQEYVIVHELCHLAVFDHSPRFWAEVGRRVPDYRARRNALRSYGWLLNVYETHYPN